MLGYTTSDDKTDCVLKEFSRNFSSDLNRT